MPPRQEKSVLKRGRANGDQDPETKKPRRSQRIAESQSRLAASPSHPPARYYLPSPRMTHPDDSPAAAATTTERDKEATATPPAGAAARPHRGAPVTAESGPPVSSSPPLGDTQAASQPHVPPAFVPDIVDEVEEGVWGYLFSLDGRSAAAAAPLVLKTRDSCSSTRRGAKAASCAPQSPGGYLVGRHRECDLRLNIPTISNRHCLIFHEKRNGDSVAILEDLSSNGTFVNEAIVGRNKRRELQDGDEITLLGEARFIFRYPRSRATGAFDQQYKILQQLGKGHFAAVYRCVERATGRNYAVKRFDKRARDRQASDGLQQEIAVLKSVNHPNVLCLKDTFDEGDAVYLVLELAPEGELFNWIVAHQKLTEDETRKVFRQLFQGLKYLHDRNIVHRDIKPENILLIDQNLTVKLADFGLAKIIGEDSFTTTLCGTPSYVAPEILENNRHRRYTRAVDIWSLGVVLYICLCGFPPFSDELYSREHPYTLADQIKLGLFNYPSPYWDHIGDPALDLIDRMLTVDPEQRITVDECLEHPWLTGRGIPSVYDSTDGLTGALGQLDVSRRRRTVDRERTLLASINDVVVSEVVEGADGLGPSSQVKIFDPTVAGRRVHNIPAPHAPHSPGPRKGRREPTPAANRDPDEFMQLGGRGDPVLFDEPRAEKPRGRRK